VSLNKIRLVVLTTWFATLIAVLGIRLLMGAPVTLAESYGWLLLGCIPAAVLLMVFRGAPPSIVGQLLYDTDHASVETMAAPGSASEFGR
jgi:hypothetical protein